MATGTVTGLLRADIQARKIDEDDLRAPMRCGFFACFVNVNVGGVLCHTSHPLRLTPRRIQKWHSNEITVKRVVVAATRRAGPYFPDPVQKRITPNGRPPHHKKDYNGRLKTHPLRFSNKSRPWWK